MQVTLYKGKTSFGPILKREKFCYSFRISYRSMFCTFFKLFANNFSNKKQFQKVFQAQNACQSFTLSIKSYRQFHLSFKLYCVFCDNSHLNIKVLALHTIEEKANFFSILNTVHTIYAFEIYFQLWELKLISNQLLHSNFKHSQIKPKPIPK